LNHLTEITKNKLHGMVAAEEKRKELKPTPKIVVIQKVPRDLSKRDLPNSIFAATRFEEDAEVKLK
jgi:hypothetical protein